LCRATFLKSRRSHQADELPSTTFSSSSAILLGSTLLDALATPLWKWKRSAMLSAATLQKNVAAGLSPARPAAQAASPVTFVDVAKEAGLNAPNVWGGVDHKRYIIEAKGSGLAFFDYDQDGWLDIYLTNGTRLDAKWPEGKAPTSHLFKNNRDGTFTDVTEKSGLARTGWQTGVCVGDYDNNGWDDLFCCFWGHNILFHNNGDGTFTDVTKKAGVYDESIAGARAALFSTTIATAGWIFYLQLHFASIPKKRRRPQILVPVERIPVMCGPARTAGDTNVLYHNNGDGTFTDVSEKSGILKPGPKYSITAVSYDFDNDGWPDIMSRWIRSRAFYFRNNHDGTFSDVAVIAGVAYSENGHEQAGNGHRRGRL